MRVLGIARNWNWGTCAEEVKKSPIGRQRISIAKNERRSNYSSVKRSNEGDTGWCVFVDKQMITRNAWNGKTG